MTVWKIGSRWSWDGSRKSSIISIFRRNNVVFVGSTDEIRKRFLNEVKIGDYFAIADGYNIVAIARAFDLPTEIENLKINTVGKESSLFNYDENKDWVCGVKVKILDLKMDQRIAYKSRGAFFEAKGISKEIIKLYNSQNERFQINSYTCTLFKSGRGSSSLLDSYTKFNIPVYQRPYSWTEREIKPFITDIMNGYLGKEKNAKYSEPMFIGTMQLSEKKYIDVKEYEQDVIDGQQRITTLSVLLKVLTILYPESSRLSNLKYDWLETRINEEQNNYLSSFFEVNLLDEDYLNFENNAYYCNAILIRNIFNELISEENINIEGENGEEMIFDIEKFCDYLFSNIYFVVIETYAGLSKTLQIFNTINTTGLDLNGSDLFKIRMYEYLTSVKNEDEKAFERISEVYALIDKKNEEAKRNVINMQGILNIYKDILIAKYGLTNLLFNYGWNTFYERLFDTLLQIKEWDHFNKVLTDKPSSNKLEISLEEIKKVIEIRFEWEVLKDKMLIETSFENMFSYHLVHRTRYSKYAKIIFLFLYKFNADERKYDNLAKLLVALNKIFTIYSIRYGKAVNEIHRFMYSLMKRIIDSESSFRDIMKVIGQRLNANYKIKDEVKKHLRGDINYNAKKKNLICWISAFLYEINSDKNIEGVKKLLFETSFDIEHIHANADASVDIEYALQNSIGNLVMMERDKNRSIKHKPFSEKKNTYKASSFSSFKSIIEQRNWGVKEMEYRKKVEVDRVMNYLFGNFIHKEYI